MWDGRKQYLIEFYGEEVAVRPAESLSMMPMNPVGALWPQTAVNLQD